MGAEGARGEEFVNEALADAKTNATIVRGNLVSANSRSISTVRQCQLPVGTRDEDEELLGWRRSIPGRWACRGSLGWWHGRRTKGRRESEGTDWRWRVASVPV